MLTCIFTACKLQTEVQIHLCIPALTNPQDQVPSYKMNLGYGQLRTLYSLQLGVGVEAEEGEGSSDVGAPIQNVIDLF